MAPVSPPREGRARLRRRVALGTRLLPLLLLGGSLVRMSVAAAQERASAARPTVGPGLDQLAAGYQPGGTLGFALRETTIAEQLYRREAGAARALLWSGHFVSRWPTTEDQLERWSAQIVGLVVAGLGADVRLAGWERLAAADLGEHRVAYRYRLTTTGSTAMGEATVVVFARGEHVGLAAAAALGSRSRIDAVDVARVLAADVRPLGPPARQPDHWREHGEGVAGDSSLTPGTESRWLGPQWHRA